MIEVEHLVKSFGTKTVLRDICFQAQAGEFVVLLGPNGAGKSTLLRILATLAKPTKGDIRVAGFQLPVHAASVRAHLGVVTHQPLLYTDLTALENLYFFGQLYGIENVSKRAEDVLELIGLSSRRRDLVRTFSRGMLQRLSIGRAILHDPRIVLFDEPYSGLDQDACEILDNILREVVANGRTVIMTSHDISRVSNMGDRFDILYKGVVVVSRKRSELQGNLQNVYHDALVS